MQSWMVGEIITLTLALSLKGEGTLDSGFRRNDGLPRGRGDLRCLSQGRGDLCCLPQGRGIYVASLKGEGIFDF